MITIRNSQRKISCNTHQLAENARVMITALGYKDFDLFVWLTTNVTITRYNRLYRHRNAPTDILAFPFHPQLRAGQRIKPTSTDDKNLGDIIISLERVERDAHTLGIPFQDHLRALLAHGICHLLGYDHIKDKDYGTMRRKELSLVRLFKPHSKPE